MFENIIKKKLLKTLSLTKVGKLTIKLPDGEVLSFIGQSPGTYADIEVSDWQVVSNVTLKGDVGFAEDYRDGLWSTKNLIDLIKFGLENDDLFQTYGFAGFWFKQISKILYLTKRNSLTGSKKNIQAHYDLGNDFYELWLDESMTYSSALFINKKDSLQKAQQQKYDRIISKLDKSGNILEIGCGWGGFAERAHERGTFNIKGITLSTEQALYAKKRLGDNTEIVIEDYRLQKGKYDSIVSIEMIEAVGEKYWPIYFKKIKDLLKPNGKAVIQGITIADDLFNQYKKSADMIRTFIFPGGMLISEKILNKELKKNGLITTDIYHFGQDYSLTLKHWLHNFDEKTEEIKKLGFDMGFIRLWRFYLASCSAEFASGKINVIQVVIEHAKEYQI